MVVYTKYVWSICTLWIIYVGVWKLCVNYTSIWFKVSPSFWRYSYQNCSCKRNTKNDFHPWTFTFLTPNGALGKLAAVRRSDRSAAPLEHLRSLRWASNVKPLTLRLLRVSFLDMLLTFPHLSGNGTNDLEYAVYLFSNHNWHNWHSRNGDSKHALPLAPRRAFAKRSSETLEELENIL